MEKWVRFPPWLTKGIKDPKFVIFQRGERGNMNGEIKWHKANGPAFLPGEKWKSCSQKNLECEIVSVRKFGTGKWDYEVTYKYPDGETHSKDAWSFQVRYYHMADETKYLGSKRKLQSSNNI